jgi:hypothetical protein
MIALPPARKPMKKRLTRKSSEFRQQQNSINISTADVQKNHREGEVAIEFVNFKFLYKKWTDSVIYAAYILHKHDSVPAFVPLRGEKDCLCPCRKTIQRSFLGAPGRQAHAVTR